MAISSRTRSKHVPRIHDTNPTKSARSAMAISTRTRSRTAEKIAAEEAATKLCDLPPEMVAMIAERLEPPGLARFHSTCRYIRNSTNNLFYETFFKNRHHLVTKSSLEALVSITATPHLRDKIESLHLHLPSIDLEAYMRNRDEVQKEQAEFWEDESGEDLFCESLSNLSALGKCTHMSLQRLEPFALRPYGLKSLQENVDDECDAGEVGKTLFQREDMIRTLFDGMMKAGFRPISLSLPGIHATNSSLYDTPIELRSCLCRLETLEITECANTPYSPGHGRDYINVYLDEIAAASMPSLEHVILRNKGERGLHSIRPALEKLKPRKLTLHYDDPPSNEAARCFGQVLQSHVETLEELTIHFETLHDIRLHQFLGHWQAFQELNVFEVRYRRKSGDVEAEDTGSEKVLRFEGKKEIQEEVQRQWALLAVVL